MNPGETGGNGSRGRAATSFWRLALMALAAAGLTALTIWLTYVQLVRYERRGMAHVPPAAEVVARVDVEQVVAFEPVRQHLLPLIDRWPLGEVGSASRSTGRLARLRQAGLNLGRDLREIVFASWDDGRNWALVLGGLFDAGEALQQIESALRSEGGSSFERGPGHLILQPWGCALAQAADGVLILARDERALATALSRAEAPGRVPPGHGLAELFVDGETLRSWLSTGSGGHAWLRAIDHARLVAEWQGELRLEAQLRVKATADVAAARGALERALADPLGPPRLVPEADWAGERAVLARSQVAAGPGVVSIESSWQRGEVDRGARSLASWLERLASRHEAGPATTGSSDWSSAQ